MFVIYVRNQQQKQKTMDKVVILARVSTDRQEYQRQINELTAYCDNVGWEVAEIFANKVSGAKKLEEREEIQNLVAYVKEHDIAGLRRLIPDGSFLIALFNDFICLGKQ